MNLRYLEGADGKIGCRPTDNFLKNPQYHVDYLEVADQGIKNLAMRGVALANQSEVLPAANVVVLALSDVALAKLSA